MKTETRMTGTTMMKTTTITTTYEKTYENDGDEKMMTMMHTQQRRSQRGAMHSNGDHLPQNVINGPSHGFGCSCRRRRKTKESREKALIIKRMTRWLWEPRCCNGPHAAKILFVYSSRWHATNNP